MKAYFVFKEWVKQTGVQKILFRFYFGVTIFLAFLFIILSTNDTLRFRVLGLSTQPTPITETVPSPTIPVLTNTPTPTSIYTQPTLPPQIQQQATSNIDCTGPDGKHFQTTQKECDNFNNAWKDPKQEPKSSGNTQPIQMIDCYDPVTRKTYRVSQETCNKWAKEYSDKGSTTNPNLITIPCDTIWGKSFGYGNSQAEAEENCSQLQLKTIQQDADIKKAAEDYGKFLNQEWNQQSTPVPTPDNSYNQQRNSQCKMDANNWYTNQGTQCGGSCSMAIKELAYPEYQQKLKNCDRQYPI